MRRLLPAFLLLIAGCGSGTSVRLHGRLLDQDGSPAAKRSVRLFTNAVDPGSQASVTTDADGRFELSAPLWDHDYDRGTQVQVAAFDGDGLERARLTVAVEDGDDVELPDVRLWDDRLRVEALPGGGARATWQEAPADEASPSYQVSLGIERSPLPLTSRSFDLSADAAARASTVQVLAGADPFECHARTCLTLFSSRAPLP